jgi:D-ala D-ala ligase C-terminus
MTELPPPDRSEDPNPELAMPLPWHRAFSNESRVGRWLGELTLRVWNIRQYLRDARVFFRFPLRLKFSTTPIERRTRVLFYGIPYADWNAPMADPALWQQIGDVGEVVRLPALWLAPAVLARIFDGRTVVIPAKIAHASRLPRGFDSLSPDAPSIHALDNKIRFAAYMLANSLQDHLPTVYAGPADAVYPCVVKRADMSSSWGVVIVQSAVQAEALLQSAMFFGKQTLLQELVPGTIEHATYCVVRGGKILWHCTFVTEVSESNIIKAEDNVTRRWTIATEPSVVAQIEKVLAPLSYSGPCNLDYKIASDGTVRIFEINPRLGGSLMLPQYKDELRRALACIVANAKACLG